MQGQMNFCDGSKPLMINKPVRLIELFAGIGSQAKALERLDINFEHWRVCEFDRFAVKSYNAVHDTNFAVSDITQLKGSDLGIEDLEKHIYIMTYSFPCTDLSKAGKQKGMSRESGTRSGLLWQVERLLTEVEHLPQILLMENVPDVLSPKFIKDFANWIAFLEGKGYKNYYQVLNAKNYGIPQNRERCFMVSFIGDYYYDFPEPIQLSRRLKDVLEKQVDEKFYLSDGQVSGIMNSSFNQTAASINDVGGVARTLCARDYKQPQSVKLSEQAAEEVRTATVGIWRLKMNDKLILAGVLRGGKWDKVNDMVKRVYSDNGISPTICTMQGGNLEPKFIEPLIGAIRGRNPDNPSDRTTGAPTKQQLEVNNSDCSNVLTTVQKDNVVVELSGIYTEVSKAFQKGSLTEMSRCLKANKHDSGVVENYRVRKLTPRECWRLMAFDDTDFDKAKWYSKEESEKLLQQYPKHKGKRQMTAEQRIERISNSQLYKQAGNSICVNALEAIFGMMVDNGYQKFTDRWK